MVSCHEDSAGNISPRLNYNHSSLELFQSRGSWVVDLLHCLYQRLLQGGGIHNDTRPVIGVSTACDTELHFILDD